MKKVIFTTVLLSVLAIANEASFFEKKVEEVKQKWDKAENGVGVEIGGWYINWEQTSNGAKNFPNNAIDTNYNIGDSVATLIKLKANYKLLSTSLEYYNSEMLGSKKDQKMKGYSFALAVIDLIPYINAEFRLLKSNFRGNINASYQGENSSGIFETELKIVDAIIYPFNKHIGFGYRSYEYEFPQDMYVLNNKTNQVIIEGLADIKYKGHFYQIVYDNKRLYDFEANIWGPIFSISAGVGKLEATAEGFEEYLTDLNAKFLEAMIGYRFKKFTNKFDFRLDIGYRYNYITTDYKTSGDYSMVTEFTTKFSGPFANIVINF